ncbi:hypothetical protein Syun_012106 [Stephania yunnanensis]|uniref:Uncharacterized protein n=1 Tax=Stephania yunnanensis TaxID=152371 RepID=A0AAP0PJ57_9MAGN
MEGRKERGRSGSAVVQWERGWWLLQCTGASDGAEDSCEEDDRAEGRRGGRDALQQRDNWRWRRRLPARTAASEAADDWCGVATGNSGARQRRRRWQRSDADGDGAANATTRRNAVRWQQRRWPAGVPASGRRRRR